MTLRAVAVAAALFASRAYAEDGAFWSTATGAVTPGPYFGSQTIVPSGNVLFVGTGDATANAQFYDPNTDTWTVTGPTGTERYGLLVAGSLTPLPSGKVLLAGGCRLSAPYSDFKFSIATAELYDPVANTWSPTSSMQSRRHNHTATLLQSGKVLVAGGENDDNGLSIVGTPLGTAELYDPTTGTWTSTGPMVRTSVGDTAILLASGKVLLANSAQLYDPATETWASTGALPNAVLPGAVPYAFAFENPTRVLPSGKVLAFATDGSVVLYDPATGLWTATGTVGAEWEGAFATPLPSGKVLVAGGVTVDSSGNAATAFNVAELYDPDTGTWSPTASMLTASYGLTAVLLNSGKVFVLGTSGGTPTAEIYTEPPPRSAYTEPATSQPSGGCNSTGGDAFALLVLSVLPWRRFGASSR